MTMAQNWQQNDHSVRNRQIFKKVPEVTISFWIIKILCTTVGETTADILSFSLGLTRASFIIGGLLLITVIFQIALRRYVPSIYWFTVILMSIVGTLMTDIMTNNFGVLPETTIIIFSTALAVIFATWYAIERTLSVQAIFTIRQETFYWLAVLFTFAAGIASEDFVSNTVDPGYGLPAILLGAGVAVLAIAYLRFKMSTALIFWIAYILTHPLGFILGSYLTDLVPWQGPLLINALFFLIILTIVIYLSFTKKGGTSWASL